jgi:hypothetical protein
MILLFPIIGLVAMVLTKAQEFTSILILVTIGQILVVRYIFIGLAFKFLSRVSLNRLRDVLDLEWKNTLSNNE